MKEKNEWKEGFKAFKNPKIKTNPYTCGNYDWFLWKAGYEQAAQLKLDKF